MEFYQAYNKIVEGINKSDTDLAVEESLDAVKKNTAVNKFILEEFKEEFG